MKNLFAHTDAGHDYPAYISINKDDAGRLRISVRSDGNGGRDLGEIHVSPETMEHMATEVLAAISGEPRAETDAKLTAIVKAFVEKHRISCAETIHQTDRVIENAYGLIEDLCEVVGYYSYPEDES